MISTLNRYIFKLWLMPFITMFLIVNAIFLIRKVSIWLPKLIEHEAPIDLIIKLFASMMPMDLALTIPIAFFFAFIKLIRELQTSSEIDAMFAGGRSIIDIFAPVFWAAIGLTLIMFWLTMELSPAGKVVTYNTASQLTSLKAEPSFEPKRFVTDVDDLVLYYEGKNPDGSYEKFMLTDSRGALSENSVYFADRAVISRVDAGLAVRLYDGTQLIGAKDKVRSTAFSTYDIVVPIKTESKFYTVDATRDVSYMDTKTLFHSLFEENVSHAKVAHWNFRLVLALSVILLFFYAVPISLRAKRAKQGGVFLWAIIVMWVINQSEMLLFKKIALGLIPWWTLWVTWFVFLALGVWMFYRAHRRAA